MYHNHQVVLSLGHWRSQPWSSTFMHSTQLPAVPYPKSNASLVKEYLPISLEVTAPESALNSDFIHTPYTHTHTTLISERERYVLNVLILILSPYKLRPDYRRLTITWLVSLLGNQPLTLI